MKNLLSIKISCLIIKILIRRALSLDDLVQYRIDVAKEKLKSASILLDAGQYKDSIGRSYYALFSYDDFYIVSRVNAEEQYRKVDEMIHAIIDYLCKSEEQ